jgi:uncharacterized lipoprotein YajG
MKKTHFLLAIFMLTSSLLVTACSRSSDTLPTLPTAVAALQLVLAR